GNLRHPRPSVLRRRSGSSGRSGVLKNAIDWASRDREEGSLMGKPGTIIGAGGRSGTARAQMQLLETLGETSTI
ncbi:MAG TPA: hypothetical protein DCM17_00550, partial [Dehalococcoidia bacterium]|nr:hypothetical protein [Dehalococcoidia bacterium]